MGADASEKNLLRLLLQRCIVPEGGLGYPVLERRPMGGRGSGRASGSVWHPRKTTAGPPRACATPCSPIVGRWRSECEPALIPPRRSPAAWPAPCSSADPSPLPALAGVGHDLRDAKKSSPSKSTAFAPRSYALAALAVRNTAHAKHATSQPYGIPARRSRNVGASVQ